VVVVVVIFFLFLLLLLFLLPPLPAMALWKCGKMGLLPTTSADWLSYIVRKETLEQSGVPISLW